MSVNRIDANWPAPPNVRAATTLRGGGASKNAWTSLNLGEHVGDDSAAVAENRRRFSLVCELPSEPLWLRQTHSINVAVDAPPQPGSATDAIVMGAVDTVCAVLTADCLPVAFAATGGDEVALAHAGWRGLCNGILEATVAAMKSSPADILVWLGPAISQSAFEVGAEVREQFLGQNSDADRHFVKNARGRFQADLYGLAKQRLGALGIRAIYGGDRCTYTESGDFFSYRRDGECGRMATYVYRTSAA